MKMNKINVHIDRIVLQGADGINASQLNAVIQQELQRLVAEQGLVNKSFQSATFKTAVSKPVKLGRSRFSENIGNNIANSIFSRVAQ